MSEFSGKFIVYIDEQLVVQYKMLQFSTNMELRSGGFGCSRSKYKYQ